MEHYRDCLLRMQAQQPGSGATVFWILVVIGLWIWGGVVLFG